MRQLPKNRMILVLLVLAAAVLIAAGILYFKGKSGGKTMLVGKEIKADDITDFYFTYDSSAYPPAFQRYRFWNENGTYYYTHETREGDHWPLRPEDVTVTGTRELSKEEWNEFFSYLENGTVTAREESLDSGDSGPWMFIYWKKDRSKYQVFTFPSWGARKTFEEYCIRLKHEMS